jgi:hypothetical protein
LVEGAGIRVRYCARLGRLGRFVRLDHRDRARLFHDLV